MSLKKYFLFISFFTCGSLFSQEVKLLSAGPKHSFRGMSVVDDKTVWVSGSQGTVGRSLDGGKSWEWMSVKGFGNCDFRDIEAFSKKEAVIMAVAEPAYLLKTSDGGKSWKKVYENAAPGMFLDAMDFYDDKNGMVVGDPINGSFFLARTKDGGNTWSKVETGFKVAEGEACFASSGTNIFFRSDNSFEIITGGIHSRRLRGTLAPDISVDSVDLFPEELPLMQGKGSSGGNSIAEKNFMNVMVAGGDFTEADSVKGNCAYTMDGGNSWHIPEFGPHGYRSCVSYLWKDTWICCGLNGVDISEDNGRYWKTISNASFHACRKAKKGTAVFFIGNDGQLGKLSP
jgi:hypothetical protein